MATKKHNIMHAEEVDGKVLELGPVFLEIKSSQKPPFQLDSLVASNEDPRRLMGVMAKLRSILHAIKLVCMRFRLLHFSAGQKSELSAGCSITS
ncbi:hypothetical protein L1987_23913 [Smallanthus sonchifolius]|uniref:Uncharacterized protein n=1 Tax=Smallanthus sonchifolius TaxID=185202 RepID=A0ACB9IIZ3_9ASTR|nr:hypothetical protein L1987_23913 [Smallanthus sonchifolius]